MYDPRNDQEEQQRKIAELLMAQAKKDAGNHDMTGVMPQVNLDVPMPAPPPQEVSVMDRMQDAFKNYQGILPWKNLYNFQELVIYKQVELEQKIESLTK